MSRFSRCDRELLVIFPLYNSLADGRTGKKILSCTLGSSLSSDSPDTALLEKRERHLSAGFPLSAPAKGTPSSTLASSPRSVDDESQETRVQIASSSTAYRSDATVTVHQANALKAYFETPELNTSFLTSGHHFMFSYRPDIAHAVGIYTTTEAPASEVIRSFVDYVDSYNYSDDLLLQGNCGNDESTDPLPPSAAAVPFGVVASVGPDSLAIAQQTVATWRNGTCITTGYEEFSSYATTIKPTKPADHADTSPLNKRDVCRTVDVQSGDLCDALADRCGGDVSVDDLRKFNPHPEDLFCETLRVP